MPQARALVVVLASSLVTVALTAVAEAAPRAQVPVVVHLERHGRIVEHQGDEVAIPAYGGGDAAWNKVVACVKSQFSPFRIDVVERAPSGDHITALIGGYASQLGLDDRSTNGVGPYMPARIQRNAIVHIFSKVGTGERDTQNLCAVTVHEVSHALGLDHTFKCGDVMSYYLDRCGARRFLDVAAPCGEFSARACGTGESTQNSYRMLAELVGLKQEPPKPEPPSTHPDPWTDDADQPDDADPPEADGEVDRAGEPATDDEQVDEADEADEADDDDDQPAVQYVEDRRGRRYTMERVQGRDGRTYIILRRVR